MKHSAIFKSMALATVCMASIPTHGMGWLFRSCRTKRQESEPEQVATTPRDAISLEHRSCCPKRQESEQEQVATTPRDTISLEHQSCCPKRQESEQEQVAITPRDTISLEQLNQLYGPYALHRAAKCGNYRLVQKLLQAGADKDARDKTLRTPLYIAAGRGHSEVVQLLVNANANLDNLLSKTALRNHEAYAEPPFEYWCRNEFKNIEAKKPMIDSPLHHAVWNGHREVVRILVNAGADKETRDGHGDTPLHIAVSRGHSAIVELLIKAGADKETRDGHGDTPLHIAVSHGHSAIVKLLIEAGADPEAYYNITPRKLISLSKYHTPLQLYAINQYIPYGIDRKQKNIELLRYLIQNGASLT